MSNYLIFGQDAIEAAIEREKECKRRAYSFIYQQGKFMAYDKFLSINGFSEARKDAKEWVKNPEAGAIPTPGGRNIALLFDHDSREIAVTTQAEAISEARAFRGICRGRRRGALLCGTDERHRRGRGPAVCARHERGRGYFDRFN